MNEHCLVPRIVQGTAEVATPMESEPVAKSHGCTKLLPPCRAERSVGT